MPSEWLLRFRALKGCHAFSETCADSLNSRDSSDGNRILLSGATHGRAIEAIEAIGTEHSEKLSGEKRPNAQVDWRALFEERAAIHFDGEHTRDEAEALAWGEIQNRWHLENGHRVPRDLCAGCRRSIGASEALDLIDGNRVHLTNSNFCLVQHGNRWRANATRALLVLGLPPPRFDPSAWLRLSG
jgi:hypothetical protein